MPAAATPPTIRTPSPGTSTIKPTSRAKKPIAIGPPMDARSSSRSRMALSVSRSVVGPLGRLELPHQYPRARATAAGRLVLDVGLRHAVLGVGAAREPPVGDH